MSVIFITYSHHDKDFALRLADDIERQGAAVWMDVKNIPGGDKWRNSVQQALQNCDTMLVVISPESMQSDQVEAEWGYFLDNKKRLVPVLFKDADIHYQLRILQYVDFCHQDYEGAFQRLTQVLQLKVSGGTTGPLDPARLARFQDKRRTEQIPVVKEKDPVPVAPDQYYFDERGTLELYILNQRPPIEINISKERVVTVGRSIPDQYVRLDIDLTPYQAELYGVSRRHASFSFSENKLYLIDLNSTNLTYLNGSSIEPHKPQALKSGDTISFGVMEATVRFRQTVPE